MCGINGHASPLDAPVDAGHVARMNGALVHRGPDEGGLADLRWCALGNRRLSIVDVAHGAQPMRSRDGRHVLVYNGELYDHRERRQALLARGRQVETACDTEVLLHTWIEEGAACLPGLNGMFAFAVADTRERSLTLARDALGIKPLYYWVGARGELVFSSELASLLRHPLVPRLLDRRSLATLLVDRCTNDPWTMLDGVQQLPPGHLLRWQAGRVQVERYWRFELAPAPRDEEQALDELRAALRESVAAQLVADVPVGVFLSGGIDSSTVAAYAARALDRPLKTFSVGFARAEYDESALAREVARHLGAEHHEIRVESARFEPELLDRVVEHVGQPLTDVSCIPTAILSRFARREVEVVLSGDGGDELFGGYDHMFWAARVRRTAERTPALLRRLGCAALAGVTPLVRGRAAHAARRARKGLALTFHEPLAQMRRLTSLWQEEELPLLLADPLPPRELPFEDAGALERLAPEELAMVVLARTSLPGAILAKVDRMSMADGLEVRVPLLDRRVVDLALSLPLALKVRGRRGKHLLRRAGEGLLPPAVHAHKKQGFALPLHDWLDAGFWDLLEELYRPGRPAAALLRPRAIAAVVADGRRAARDDGRRSSQAAAARAWTLAQLGRWIERFDVEVA